MTQHKRWLPRKVYRQRIEAMVNLIDMKPEGMTTFEMIRTRDETGTSGTGKVLEGIVFHDGAVTIHWLGKYWSITTFPDWSTFVNIHIGAHPQNGTIIAFSNGTQWSQTTGLVEALDGC